MTRITRILALPLLVAAVLIATACGNSTNTTSSGTGMPGMGTSPMMSSAPSPMGSGMAGMPGMGDSDMYTGTGLAATVSGFTFTPATTTLASGKKTSFRFAIRDSTGMALKDFADDQTKLMHFYLVRSDLTGFQHIHPTMAGDGTWTAALAPLQAGTWRAYASFIAKDMSGKQTPLVLSAPLRVPGGMAMTTTLPKAAPSTEVDGYTLKMSGEAMMASMTHALTVTITRGGKPVTDLQPYLDTYAHLTAFHQGDMAFAHLHPQGEAMGDHGGPTLTFQAVLAKAGNWRLFLQFQTGGTLHTAAITVTVG
ncbi:MAG TPA: hypothetical protein VJT31_00405 [Rugosimonospora sp.]|nr:hypothetical protein [Rugosimonospora sp.]